MHLNPRPERRGEDLKKKRVWVVFLALAAWNVPRANAICRLMDSASAEVA